MRYAAALILSVESEMPTATSPPTRERIAMHLSGSQVAQQVGQMPLRNLILAAY
jgi:hypothetical protein